MILQNRCNRRILLFAVCTISSYSAVAIVISASNAKTQINTPYPATCQLMGFLRSKGIEAEQMDLSIELIQKLFTASYLTEIFQKVALGDKLSKTNKI